LSHKVTVKLDVVVHVASIMFWWVDEVEILLFLEFTIPPGGVMAGTS
jgi:hypothetical protein